MLYRIAYTFRNTKKLQSESETFMPGEIVIKIMAYFMGHIICWEVFYCIISKLKEKKNPVTEKYLLNL